ncbi:MAG: glycoside hydrolase family 5 protein [Butyribacter sp.]|nr:glycoside hydrolase family 5 protein [bacterium]MDY3853758.1 glycoside hydrolase family 5 protein [Butyribacter sp.]
MKNRKKITLWKIASALCILFIVCVGAKTTVKASPVSANGQLQVKGSKIVNQKGKTFVIKGVSTHGIAWYPQYVQKKSFASLKKQGVNTIRLAMYTEEYGGYCSGGDKKQLKKTLDKGVKAATELGMYVIIDWHILQDGNPLQHKNQAKKFFKEIAKKYAKHNNVLFEICNEPNGNGGSLKNIRKYANAVIKTIRSVNKKAIIIVGTPTWSQDVDLAAKNPIKGKNIAYAFHFYAATHKQYLRDKLKTAVKAGLPVIVTEFGITEASGSGKVDTKEGNKWMKLLNQYKIGRVCWNLSNKAEKSSLLKPSCKKTSGWKKSDWSKQGKWLLKAYS